MPKRNIVHCGLYHERTENTEGFREKAFAEKWAEWNTPERSVHTNFGYGTLQDLFIKGSPIDFLAKREVDRIITAEDAQLVATVIQWLGSNCGWSFLTEALGEAGFRIVKTD